MTLYRIYGDDAKYLNFVVDASDCEEKLGFDHPFHLDSRPVPYAPVWKTPLLVDLHYGRQGRNKPVPDIAENGGHVGFIDGGPPWRPTYYLPERLLGFLEPFAAKPGL